MLRARRAARSSLPGLRDGRQVTGPLGVVPYRTLEYWQDRMMLQVQGVALDIGGRENDMRRTTDDDTLGGPWGSQCTAVSVLVSVLSNVEYLSLREAPKQRIGTVERIDDQNMAIITPDRLPVYTRT